jgi:hemerythrin-like metal-binding protein
VPAPLVWNAAHEVGIPEIDEQHAMLVSLLNELADALRNGEAHEAALREVIRYTGFHFATEERLMRGRHYDGAAAHRDMHRRLEPQSGVLAHPTQPGLGMDLDEARIEAKFELEV